MVNPATATFWCSWQGAEDSDETIIEDVAILGAEAAIAWGRARSADVVIRLGHKGDTCFWAGDGVEPRDGYEDDEESLPVWPPIGPPPHGWWEGPSEL
jgi:hypothetical protein